MEDHNKENQLDDSLVWEEVHMEHIVQDEWSHLLTIPSNATIADNYAHIFMAKNCRTVSGQDLDDTEFLNVIKLPAEMIEKMIDAGQFQQAIHITAWLLAQRRE